MAGGTGCGLAMVFCVGNRNERQMQVRVLVAENCTWRERLTLFARQRQIRDD
jgi:hypothetical protein